ncbi:MAG: 3-phosphoshikimate 1-carboxyvinyltransferase [Bacteroides sp.]
MQIKISAPANIEASILLPASKSISNRVLIINALGKGNYVPDNLSECDDTRVMIKALSSVDESIDIMAAGTAMRFLTAYLSVSEGTRNITGTKRMQERPIRLLVDSLRGLGANIEYVNNSGCPPLRIEGRKLTGDYVTLRGDVSSQYISALLMIAPTLKNGLTLQLNGKVISKPYINLTLQLMRDFGAVADWMDSNCIRVLPKPYASVPFTVESDWSAASYWYQIVAFSENAQVELLGLFPNSYQGDSRVAELFTLLGVDTNFTSRGVVLKKIERFTDRFEHDFINEPDLAQTFVVTCALMNVPFRFSGLQSLKIKETDRIAALITELSKLGYVLRETDDSTLSWDGERTRENVCPIIDTYEDHRMAMAFAPACLKIPALIINEPQVVSKSYPGYWNDLSKAGFSVTEVR